MGPKFWIFQRISSRINWSTILDFQRFFFKGLLGTKLWIFKDFVGQNQLRFFSKAIRNFLRTFLKY